MKIIIGITIIVILAALGSRWTFTRIRLPLAARHIYLTGTEYIFLGIGLGSGLLNLLDVTTMKGLSPVLHLALGWVGMMYGAQLDFRQLIRFPRQFLEISLLQGAVTLVVCSGGFYLLSGWSPKPSSSIEGTLLATSSLAAWALGAFAAPTAQSSLALLEQELNAKQAPVMQLLRYVTSVDALLGLFVLGLLFATAHPASPFGFNMFVPAQMLVLSLFLGLITGGILHLLTRIQCSQEELLLFTIGVVVFTSGGASFLKLSPLFITLVSGVLIANLRSQKERIVQALISLEKPMYLILLIFGGAMVPLNASLKTAIPYGLLYLVLRLFGKTLGGLLSQPLIKRPQFRTPWMGLGLLSQGGIAVAMVVNFQHAFAGPFADMVLTMVLLAVVLNEFASPTLTRFVISRSPEF